MKLNKLFESVIREAGRKPTIVRIQVEDGNYLFVPTEVGGAWKDLDGNGGWLYTGTLDDFAGEMYSNGDIEESRGKIIKLAKQTPVGKSFELLGKVTDSIACWMLDPNGTETADSYYK